MDIRPEALLNCSNETELSRELQRIAGVLDFQCCSASLLIEKGGGIVQTYAVASIPEPYQAQFYDPADAARDPVMQRVRVSSAPVAWSQADYVSGNAGDLWEHQAAHGLGCGITSAAHLPTGRHIVWGVERPQPLPTTERTRARLVATTHLVTTYLIEVMPKVFKLDTLPMDCPVLSPREMEVLKWTSAGKSAWEIGQILSIAESTVNAHLSRVRCAFGVSTKAHAIARAAMLGMLAA